MMQLGSLYPCKFKTFGECAWFHKKKIEMRANNDDDNSMIFKETTVQNISIYIFN